ncbi:nucleotidyltransferase family protein [Marimonas lutisalis]|uniref:nucleotidyltransferase family protein n=1 Tax=Marimonas lutisalis TaxID=2545756 RepID=UPI0010F4D722|nr:nucleotidyltransferase family protein [Marimonas lutisalis]
MSDVLILIPAAGASSRMRGRDKLMELVDGEPLLRRQVRRALATGTDVVVTVSREFPQRAEVLKQIASPSLTVLDGIDGREGLAVSLREAARVAKNAAGLMVLLADMPEITRADIETMLNAFRAEPDAVHRATDRDGTPGHPVVFPERLFPKLAQITGDRGARDVLREETVRMTPLPARHAVTDLDTPEDWAAWRAARDG